MLLQLHEQYAINNNANLGSMVTLMAAVIAIIGGYGYVFLHLDMYIGDEQLLCMHPEFSLVSLILTATATTIVLAILKYICMYQGFAQRKEQFIIYAIRYKYNLGIGKSTTSERIFPNTYYPFYKEGIKIYQGLFGEFIKIFTAIQFLIILSVIISISLNIVHNCGNGVDHHLLIATIIFFVTLVLCIIFSKNKQKNDKEVYDNYCKDYETYSQCKVSHVK